MKLDNRVKKHAFDLRKEGKSYSQISKITGVAKGTLSYWFSKVSWSNKVKENLLERNRRDSRNKVILMNKRRAEIRQANITKIKQEAKQEFEKFKDNPLFLTAVSLYWGEGSKTHNGRVSVINSDPELLKIIISFYREILNITDSDIRVEMFIYQDHDEIELKKYWSEILKLRQDNFIKTQRLKSRSTHTKRKLSKGVCAVYFSNTAISIKILEWIELLADHLVIS